MDTLELYHDRGAGFLSWTLAAACSEYFATVSRDGALSLSDVLHWLPGERDRINQELEPDEQIPLPRLLSERDIAGDDEVWFTGRRRGYIPTISLEERQQREEHALHNQEPFLRQYCSGAEIGDFDEEKILAYARKQQGFSRLPLENVIELCKRLGLASSVGTPRRSAVLAFHKFPNRYISPAVIRVTLRTLDNNIYSRDTIEGFLGGQVEKAIQWLISNLRTIREDMEVGQRIDRCEIPEKALQELVVNAVLHRDYEANESIQIKITPKQVIITNPGRLNSAIAMNDSPFSYRDSHPHNPELLDVLIAQRWAEGIAHGFEIITEEFQKYSLKLPEIKNLPGGLVQVTIQRPDISTISSAELTVSESVSTRIPGDLNVTMPVATVEEKAAPIWNIPYARNPHFIGRQEELDRLEKALKTGQTAALTQAISGLGGIGKTQIALEYTYRHQKDYQTVFWLQANSRETLVSSFATLAQILKLPEKDETDQEAIVQAVQRWLREHEKWLLIFDNADELSMVREFLPSASGGHIILTTRAQVIGKVAQRLEVDTLDEQVGALLLLRRAGLVEPDATLDTASLLDQSMALALTKELGGLPLALDQAGAYIEETQCGLADYQQQYQTRRAKLLARRGGLVDDHPQSVATTWSMSFAKVEQVNPIAADLLRICAFLAPDAIPEELLAEAMKTPPGGIEPGQNGGDEFSLVISRGKYSLEKNTGEIHEAVATLRAYSLIQRHARENVVQVHRLVQAVVRDSLERQEIWMTRVVRAVNVCFPAVRFETWEQCERYLPQALACDVWISQAHLNLLEGASLLNRTGLYLNDRARYGEAEPLLMRALSIREQQLGAEHPDTALSLNNLATLYQAQGKYEQAEPLLVRALAIREQHLGAQHPDTASSLNNLALLYDSLGKYEQAEPLYVRALAIREQQLGAEHPDTASSLNNLALLYDSLGKYEQAEPLLERALSIREQQLGAQHPDTASSLNNLALLYDSLGKYEQAEPLLVRALAIWEQQLGAQHPSTARSLNNLAELYRVQGKYEQAEPLLVRALSIREQQLGAQHPDTASSLNNLALLYQTQGKYAQAKPLLVHALVLREQQLGAQHPDTASSLNNLALLYGSLGKYEQAEPLLMRALAICEQQLGAMHPNTQTIRANYASLLKEMKQGIEAIQSETEDKLPSFGGHDEPSRNEGHYLIGPNDLDPNY